MGRGVQKDALNNAGEGAQLSNQYNSNVGNLQHTLFPQLKGMATNPQGFSPLDLNAMNTASQQSIGGSTAGAVGQAGLEAARTRNVGGQSAALDESSRQGMRQNSENALEIQGNNALMKEHHRSEGLSGLEHLYGQNMQGTLGALGLSNQSLGEATNASRATTDVWQPLVLQMMSNAQKAAGAAGA